MRRHLTYANLVASLSLVIAVAGGAAFAATQLPKNSVKSKQIAPRAVKASDIKNDAVTGTKVKESTLGTVPNSAKVGGIAVGPIKVAMDDGQANLILLDIDGARVTLTCGNGGTTGLDVRTLSADSPTIVYAIAAAGAVSTGRMTAINSLGLQNLAIDGDLTIRESSGAVTHVELTTYREDNGAGTKDCFTQGTISRY